MQIGDKVHVSGTVRDIKEGSVLMVCVDDREYWLLEKNVEVDAPVPEEKPVEPAAHVVEPEAQATKTDPLPHRTATVTRPSR
jgi:hypothetical protein